MVVVIGWHLPISEFEERHSARIHPSSQQAVGRPGILGHLESTRISRDHGKESLLHAKTEKPIKEPPCPPTPFIHCYRLTLATRLLHLNNQPSL